MRRPTLVWPEKRWFWGGFLAFFPVGLLLGWRTQPAAVLSSPSVRPSRPLIYFLAFWALFQVGVPLIHHTIPGDANWTEEWQNFSWRMMLRAKSAGYAMYHVQDPGLQTTDATGRKLIQWDKLPANRPHAIYVPVDCRLLDWGHHPGLTNTFEPCLGQRFVYVLPKGQADQVPLIQQRLVKTWEKEFQTTPVVEESIDLTTALKTLSSIIREYLAAHPQAPSAEALQALDWALLADKNAGEMEKNYIFIVDVLARIQDDHWHTLANPVLRRLHPFALQGAKYPDQQFLIVHSPEGLSNQQRLQLTQGKPYMVWVDLSRLRPFAWREMPEWFITYEEQQLQMVWNYFHELNQIQLERFAVRPSMLYLYAKHVAERWEAEYGRRPQVFAHSMVMLNYRYPRPLVDPNFNLADVDYRLFQKFHNLLKQ